MVRAIVSPAVRACLLASCLTAIVGFMPSPAFALPDPTQVVLTATANTTGVTACDGLSGKSCLGQRVDFQVGVINQNSTGNGSPVGTVFFIDENNVTIGSAVLAANGDGVSSS